MADIDFSLADAVKKEEFFSALADSDLQSILKALNKVTLKKGETLIKQGTYRWSVALSFMKNIGSD